MKPLISRRALGKAAAALGMLAMPALARAAPGLRIGYQKNGSLVILRQQDRLGALGVPVQWVEFPSGPLMLEALNAGAIDFGATGDTPPIFAQAAGSALVYVGAQPNSGANEALLVQEKGPVNSLADLRGKRIAFTKGSSSHYLVIKALAAAGMKLSDVQPVYLQPPDGGAAFRSGAVDAWSVWDPFYAIAQLQPGVRVLTSGVGVAPTNAFFLAGQTFAQRQPGLVLALLDAINAAADWARANPDALADTLTAITAVPLPAQRLAAPRGLYAVQPMDDAVIALQQSVADVFTANHVIPTRIDVRAAVWTPPSQKASELGQKQ